MLSRLVQGGSESGVRPDYRNAWRAVAAGAPQPWPQARSATPVTVPGVVEIVLTERLLQE
jgi:hypothetical protein